MPNKNNAKPNQQKETTANQTKSPPAAISSTNGKLVAEWNSVLSDREPQAMHGIKRIGRSSCGRTGHSFVFEPRGGEDPHSHSIL